MRTVYASSIILGTDKFAFVFHVNSDDLEDGFSLYIPPDLYKKAIMDALQSIEKYEKEHGEIDITAIDSTEHNKTKNDTTEFS